MSHSFWAPFSRFFRERREISPFRRKKANPANQSKDRRPSQSKDPAAGAGGGEPVRAEDSGITGAGMAGRGLAAFGREKGQRRRNSTPSHKRQVRYLGKGRRQSRSRSTAHGRSDLQPALTQNQKESFHHGVHSFHWRIICSRLSISSELNFVREVKAATK